MFIYRCPYQSIAFSKIIITGELDFLLMVIDTFKICCNSISAQEMFRCYLEIAAKEICCNCQCGNNATIKHEVYIGLFFLSKCNVNQQGAVLWHLWDFITDCCMTNQHFIDSEMYYKVL